MKSFLGHTQRTEIESQRDYFKKQLNNPLVKDTVAVTKNLRRVEHTLETQAPPVLKGPELDKVVRREKELRERIVPNMLSQAEMRLAPAGSVGREMAFQKRFKPEILEWKNCRRTIYRDSEDPDVANLERYRPTVSRGNLDNAQLTGKDFNFPSPQFQENYEKLDPAVSVCDDGNEFETEASKQRRARLAELRAEMAELESEEETAPPQLGLEEG